MVILIFWILTPSNGLQQTCIFQSPTYFINTVEGTTKSYWKCHVNNVKLLIENELVTTDFSANSKPNANVTAFLYHIGNDIKFIPNSIFVDFINIEHFYINSNQGFETMKPEFLRNATKLISFFVHSNIISRLDANIFIEAPTLEHINLQNNKIETIHFLTFSGLPNLKNVYLNNNKVTNLYPVTFSHHPHLLTLNLMENTCINKKFSNASHEIPLISAEIATACKFNWSIDDVLEITVQKEKMAGKKVVRLLNQFDQMNNYIQDKKSADLKSYSKYVKSMIDLM